MARYHSPTLGVLAVAAVCALTHSQVRAQETIDCGQAACVQFSPETPTEMITGSTHVVYVNYRFLNGSYGFTDPDSGQPIGARLVLESSDYFLGTGSVFSNATWSGSCELLQANPWRVRCEWVRAPWVQDAAENSVENVWVALRSQRGDTPDGYAARFHARLETKRDVDSAMLLHEDEHTAIIDGEANLRLEQLQRINGGYGYVPDGNGNYIKGRRHRLYFIPANYIRPGDFTDPPALTSPEYDPKLTDPNHFDQATSERVGGNLLENVVVDIALPDWVHFYGARFGSGAFYDAEGEGSAGWIIDEAPSLGSLGGNLRVTFDQTGSYALER